MENRVKITRDDITRMDVDAIVNAANTDLMLGSGVAGAIRTKGGPSIQRECDDHGPVSLGEAALTGGGDLKAKYVIHAAGMRLGGRVSRESLESSTRSSLIKASEMKLRTIAFPAIGTGVGGFPVDECAQVMIDVVLDFLNTESTSIETIYFVLFDDTSYEIFKGVLDRGN